MKIALLLQRFDPLGGGLERYAADWAGWLCDRGHDVHIVTGSGENAPIGIALHAVGGLRDDPLDQAHRLAERAAALKPDIVQDFGDGLGSDVFQPLGGARAAARAGELAALDPLRRIKRHLSARWRRRGRAMLKLERWQVRGPGTTIIACSQRVSDDLVRLSGAAPSRIRIIYNAVDCQHLRPATPAARLAARSSLGLPTAGTLFLQVAHNFRLKGVASSLKAIARLAGEGLDCALAVAGEGPNLEAYRKLAGSLGAAGHVYFLGPVDDMRTLFAAADALVHPAFYDACSLACLEALACGLPVAVSRADGASGLLTHGVQGWLIDDPVNPKEIAFRMTQLLDPGLREAMGAQARVLAEHNDRADAFRRLEALCEEIARAKS
jgi:UDP-glucose:(heptosyl)LPS alpha-1,3-glucosyltransferase